MIKMKRYRTEYLAPFGKRREKKKSFVKVNKISLFIIYRK